MIFKMSFRGDKKAQGLSTNAIILIILGVIVLAVLAIGFTFGWSMLKDKISPSNNVQTIADACSSACITNSQYDFCTATRDLKTEDTEIKGGTCYYLAEKQAKYGISKCETVSCSANNVLLDKLDTSVTEPDCDEDNKGKTVYALSSDETTLLSKECSS